MPRLMQSLLVVVVSMALNATAWDSAYAQKKDNRRLAFIDAANAHPDFEWQGEFYGKIGTGKQTVGFQVSALGDGSFQAVEFVGGLPGSGWDKSPRKRMTGTLKDGKLSFQGESRRFDIGKDTATVFDSSGRKLGQLDKVLRESPTMGKKPPFGARVLFNGLHTRQFKKGRMSEDHLLQEGTETKSSYSDFTLHIEFRLPFMPYARGQGRANSGVYLQGRYEVQILDSFTLDGVHNECGGLYKFRQPDVNMCLPPLIWQTYDIHFTAAKFRDGKKIANALLTVRHNGVLIHDGVELKNKTGAGAKEGPLARATKLQNHGNPVRYRNIWIIDRAHPEPIDISPPGIRYADPAADFLGAGPPLR